MQPPAENKRKAHQAAFFLKAGAVPSIGGIRDREQERLS
jgi:hypothetical protein